MVIHMQLTDHISLQIHNDNDLMFEHLLGTM
jgi:hypothetical protein